MDITYEVLKVTSYPSRFGPGMMYYVFMKSSEGKSYKTAVDDSFRNYSQWKPYMVPGVVLTGIKTKLDKKGKEIVDADSTPRLVNTKAAEDFDDKITDAEPEQGVMF